MIKINSKRFAKAVIDVADVVNLNIDRDIYKNIVLKTGKNALSIYGTDGANYLLRAVPAEVKEQMIVALPVAGIKKFAGRLKKDNTISISSKDFKLKINAGFRATLNLGVSAFDFPALTTMIGEFSGLKTIYKKVEKCLNSKLQSNALFNAIQFLPNCIAGTDGRHAAVCWGEYGIEEFAFPDIFKHITDDEYRVFNERGFLGFMGNNSILLASKANIRGFHDVRPVFSMDGDEMIVDFNEFYDAILAIDAFLNIKKDKSLGVKVEVSTGNAKAHNEKGVIENEFKCEGEIKTTYLNARFVLEALNAIDKADKLTMRDIGKAVIFNDEQLVVKMRGDAR